MKRRQFGNEASIEAVTPQEPGHARLTRKAAGGAAWLISARLLAKGIDFLALLILARLLNPAQFGIIAIAMTLILIVEAVLELPTGQVLISLSAIEKLHLDTAFTLGVLRGLIVALCLSALAIPFSRIYGDKRLLILIPVLSFAPAMRGMQSPRMVFFSRRLDYRRDFAIEFGSKFFASVASTTFAFIFRDYRALAVGTLATPLAMVVISYILAPYRPRISLKSWPLFSHFLSSSTISQLLAAVGWQCDRLILGRYSSRTALGEFSLANDLSYLPEQSLIKPIVRPLMSAFSLIKHDSARLELAYAKAATTVLAIGTPVMVGLSVLADPAVRFALGGKWIAAIPILKWLSLTLIPPLLISPLPSLAMALGRPNIVVRQLVAEMTFKIPMIVLGAMLFGVEGVVWARGIATLIAAAVSLHYVKVLVATPITLQIARTWRVAASGTVLALTLIFLRRSLVGYAGPLLGLRLVLVSLVGACIYIGCLGSLWHASGRPNGAERHFFEIFRDARLWLAPNDLW